MQDKKCVLVTIVGKTDPIRGQFDGPILHIIRHYHPQKAVLILTQEIAKEENEYHHNEDAIHLLDSECEVELISTGIEKPHSYDDFSLPLLTICNEVKNQNNDSKILLNITSGTPQMETALCMIAISNPEIYIPIQVFSPEDGSNKSEFFDPTKHLIEEWFENDLDNIEEAPSRCHVPQLLNFKRPLIQFQILSLIEHYDYAGALQLYEENKDNFSSRVGILLKHAKMRLNLEEKAAKALAKELKIEKELYPIARADIGRLVEFYNSMHIKQIRGELNDFSMRMEIMTEYLGLYILEKCMNVKQEEIAILKKKDTKKVWYLTKEKCISKIPGIDSFMDKQFARSGWQNQKMKDSYEWGRPLNGLSIILIIRYLSLQPSYSRYASCTEEMLKWTDFSSQVRNPVAHTMVAITEEKVKKAYGNKDSADLCKAIRTIMIQVFEKEVKADVFEMYETINEKIHEYMESE